MQRKTSYIIFVLCLMVVYSCQNNPKFPDPLQAGWKGESVCEVLHEDREQRILKCSFPPGVGHEKHYHKPYFGYALSGGRMRLIQESGTREVNLPTGSSFFNKGVDWHEVLNVGTTTVIYLIVESK